MNGTGDFTQSRKGRKGSEPEKTHHGDTEARRIGPGRGPAKSDLTGQFVSWRGMRKRGNEKSFRLIFLPTGNHERTPATGFRESPFSTLCASVSPAKRAVPCTASERRRVVNLSVSEPLRPLRCAWRSFLTKLWPLRGHSFLHSGDGEDGFSQSRQVRQV
jgi:hypothetical protein